MEFLERLERYAPRLTHTEKRVADYVLAHQSETLRSSIADLAALSQSSRSAVLRFAQKLGYSGYTEFRYDFSLFVHAGRISQVENQNRIQQLTSYYESTIHKISDYISESLLEQLSACMAHARRLKIFGMNRNSYSAQQLRHHLHTLNLDAEAVSDPVLVRDLSAAGTAEDVHIYFSVSGDTPIIRDAIQSSCEQGAKTILVTMHHDSPMSNYATHLVVLPSTRLCTTDYFFDQQAINFIFIELLIVYLGTALTAPQNPPPEDSDPAASD